MTAQEIDLIIDLHLDAEQQGPGSAKETKKALDLIGINDQQDLKIADIGCGTGAQTMTIAQNLNGHITAVDLFPAFLAKLNDKAQALGLQEKITTLARPMEDLPFQPEQFDIIWSEGAIYNMGFASGVRAWRQFLKPGGYLAVSEISWITHARPSEIEQYWASQYPEIDTISNKIRVLEEHGYSPVAHFILPPYCWLEAYYEPMEARFAAFLERHGNSDLAKQIVAAEKEEIATYRKYKDYYSYGFYVARKV